MKNRLCVALLFALPLLAPLRAEAQEPKPDPKAVNELWRAVSACQQVKNYGIDESRYQEYVMQRDLAAKIDPSIKTSSIAVKGMVPKVGLPKCDKLFDDYARGVGLEDTPVTDSCVRNTNFSLDPILRDAESGYAEQKDKFIVWFQRKALESARWYMYSKDGYQSLGTRCATPDSKRKAFAAIDAKFKRAEAIVQKIEAAKGIAFKGVRNGTFIVYVDVKTNKEVPRADFL